MMILNKDKAYNDLVEKWKNFRYEPDIINPYEIENGALESNHLNPWAKWHGNLNADILLIGQDWGTENFYKVNKGSDPENNDTNKRLRELFNEIGIDIGTPKDRDENLPLYFTNAVLGLKKGDMNESVRSNWYLDTAVEFIKPLIEIIHPGIIIAMGQAAFETVAEIYKIKKEPLNQIIDKNPKILSDDIKLFVVFHCSRNGSRNRVFETQKEDWRKIKEHYKYS